MNKKSCFSLLLCLLGISLLRATPSEDTLKILSWNVQMLPRKMIHKQQLLRVNWIVDDLKKTDFDLIVLQEVFDKKALNLLTKGLKEAFPYQIGTHSHPFYRWKQSDGILILSKNPLQKLKHIFYTRGTGGDLLASKGCLLVEGRIKNKKFQIAATHLQSGRGHRREAIRNKQLQEIQTQILSPFCQNNIPQFVVGDLNIVKEMSACYNSMLSTLAAKDTLLNDPRPFTFDIQNSWNSSYPTVTNSQLDYILCRKNKTPLFIQKLYLRRINRELNRKKMDLADHYGLATEIILH